MICKVFPNPSNSSSNLFKTHYKLDTPYKFKVYVKNPQTPVLKEGHPVFLKEEQIEEISDIESIKKFHLKIKERSQLNSKEEEYTHGRLVMNK